MNSQKRIDVLRQRNLDLSQKLQDTQKQLNEAKNADTEKTERLDKLIAELEQIQKDFISTLDELQEARDKYFALNRELIEIKKEFLPWYRKIFKHR